MVSQRQLFLTYQAQTSDIPLMLEIEKAEGVYLYDTEGKEYIDLISGISVSNLGHRHPAVVKAIKGQLDKYMHLMVYGEYIQSPQVGLAQLLARQLPEPLKVTYFVNSGSEATEGAMKLAKRYTGRHGIIAFKKAYHGSTQGALSVIGEESFKKSFRPLLPGIRYLDFNDPNQLEQITTRTAAVIVETVQGEAGIRIPDPKYLYALRQKCMSTGALLILDEVQCGFGRTGKLFAFQHYNIQPDILTLAKGMGGGMPLGAFISSSEIMGSFISKPVLGNITTFGGNAVCCAAGLATLKTLLETGLIEAVGEKERLFKKLLRHPAIKAVRSKGLLIAVEFEGFEFNKKVIDHCIRGGVVTDWFLFADNCLRIAPPLIITEGQIEKSCEVILESIEAAIKTKGQG